MAERERYTGSQKVDTSQALNEGIERFADAMLAGG